MACQGCKERREWIEKWTKVAYERARKAFGQDDRSAGGANRPDHELGGVDEQPIAEPVKRARRRK